MKKNIILVFTDFGISDEKGGGISTAMFNLNHYLRFDFDLVFVNNEINFFEKFKLIYNNRDCVIYINGLFSIISNLFPFLFYSFFTNYKIILSPRGMLKNSALIRNKTFKLFFIWIYNLNKDMSLHVTDENEESRAKFFFKKNKIYVIPDFMPIQYEFKNRKKIPGEIDIIFVGRIDPIKNLTFAFDVLKIITNQITARINFFVIGPIYDTSYFKRCSETASGFDREKINIVFLGELDRNKIQNFYDSAHLLFLPSKGENFGYAIAESLANSIPVLISDQTFFTSVNDLGLGNSFALNDIDRFVNSLIKYINLTDIEFNKISSFIHKYYNKLIPPNLNNSYNLLFK